MNGTLPAAHDTPCTRDWANLPPPFLKAVSLHLRINKLKESRLACKPWARHLVAGLGKITIWPAMLHTRSTSRDSTSDYISEGTGYFPELLLSGISSDTQVHLAFSARHRPTRQQLDLLCTLLSTAAATRLSYQWCDDLGSSFTVQLDLNFFLRYILDHTTAITPRLSTWITTDTAHRIADAELLLPRVDKLQRLRAVRATFWSQGPTLLRQLAQLTALQSLYLCLPHHDSGGSSSDSSSCSLCSYTEADAPCSSTADSTSSSKCSDASPSHTTTSSGSGSSSRCMQDVLDTLSSLRRLSELSVTFLPQGSHVVIPSWPHLTRLVDLSAAANAAAGDGTPADHHTPGCAPDTKVLSAHHASSLKALCLAPLALPEAADGCEEALAAVECYTLLPGPQQRSAGEQQQLLQQVAVAPELPAVTQLAVQCAVSFQALAQLLQGLPKLQALDLSGLDHSHVLDGILPDVQPQQVLNLELYLQQQQQQYLAALQDYQQGLVAFLEQLPAASPALAALRTTRLPPTAGEEAEAEDLVWKSEQSQRAGQALGQLTGLRSLLLLPQTVWLRSLEALQALAGLQELQAGVQVLDVGHLPAGLTALTVATRAVLDDAWQRRQAQAQGWCEQRTDQEEEQQQGGEGQQRGQASSSAQEAASSQQGAGTPNEQQQGQQPPAAAACLPQLQRLVYQPYVDHDSCDLLLLAPLLQQAAEHIEMHAWADWSHFSFPATLRSLTARSMWPGCAAQLAPLRGLTSLSFLKREDRYLLLDVWEEVDGLVGMTQLRQLQLPWREALSEGQGGRLGEGSLPWSEGAQLGLLLDRLQRALPWCVLRVV